MSQSRYSHLAKQIQHTNGKRKGIGGGGKEKEPWVYFQTYDFMLLSFSVTFKEDLIRTNVAIRPCARSWNFF